MHSSVLTICKRAREREREKREREKREREKWNWHEKADSSYRGLDLRLNTIHLSGRPTLAGPRHAPLVEGDSDTMCSMQQRLSASVTRSQVLPGAVTVDDSDSRCWCQWSQSIKLCFVFSNGKEVEGSLWKLGSTRASVLYFANRAQVVGRPGELCFANRAQVIGRPGVLYFANRAQVEGTCCILPIGRR